MSGSIRLGSPPSAAMASRIAARSTTAGTPVKSWRSTRAGAKVISLDGSSLPTHVATASTSSRVTVSPSSRRRRFSSRIRACTAAARRRSATAAHRAGRPRGSRRRGSGSRGRRRSRDGSWLSLSGWGSVGSRLEGEAEDTEVVVEPEDGGRAAFGRRHRPDAVCERERQVGILRSIRSHARASSEGLHDGRSGVRTRPPPRADRGTRAPRRAPRRSEPGGGLGRRGSEVSRTSPASRSVA